MGMRRGVTRPRRFRENLPEYEERMYGNEPYEPPLERRTHPYKMYEPPGPAPGHAYGMAGIMQHLRGLDLPASKDEILDMVDPDETFEYRKGVLVNLHDILEDIPDEEYDAINQLAEEVSNVLRSEGIESGSRRRGY